MKPNKPLRMRREADTYYIWVGGSCDYAHEERAGGGAYVMECNDRTVERYAVSDFHTTEFRMMLTVMLHALEVLPEDSTVVFLTNVAYIQQNFDKQPTEKSANADLLVQGLEAVKRHKSVTVKVVSYHKYAQLPETHEMAHGAMTKLRNGQ